MAEFHLALHPGFLPDQWKVTCVQTLCSSIVNITFILTMVRGGRQTGARLKLNLASSNGSPY